jgi:ketosteroid isomerase-like protein
VKPEPDQSAVELSRRGFAAFSSGDWDKALATMHPEVEWHVAFALPDLPLGKTVFRGREEVRELWAAFTSIWERITIEMEAVESLSGAEGRWVLVARSRFRGQGGASGAQVDRVVHYVLETEGDLLRRIRPFDTEADALAAAGLERDP